jgi:hypothetical protein
MLGMRRLVASQQRCCSMTTTTTRMATMMIPRHQMTSRAATSLSLSLSSTLSRNSSRSMSCMMIPARPAFAASSLSKSSLDQHDNSSSFQYRTFFVNASGARFMPVKTVDVRSSAKKFVTTLYQTVKCRLYSFKCCFWLLIIHSTLFFLIRKIFLLCKN